MTSDKKNVDEYLATVPEERLPAMQRLRTLCLSTLYGYEETMRYGMPCYEVNDTTPVAFNSQKNYISLYVPPVILDEYREELKQLNVGKSCIRYRKPAQIDWTQVERILTDVNNKAENL